MKLRDPRGRWALRIAHSDAGNWSKFVLLVLASRMDHRGYIELSERDMRILFGRHRARIRDALREARTHQLLDVVKRPAPGRCAVYAAMFGGAVPAGVKLGNASLSLRRAATDEILQVELGVSAKVLVLVFVYLMNSERRVRGPGRAELAQLLGIAESTVADRIGQATKPGFLQLIDGGTRGRRAHYALEGAKGIGHRDMSRSSCPGEPDAQSDTQAIAQRTHRVAGFRTHYARALQDAPRKTRRVHSSFTAQAARCRKLRRPEGTRIVLLSDVRPADQAFASVYRHVHPQR